MSMKSNKQTYSSTSKLIMLLLVLLCMNINVSAQFAEPALSGANFVANQVDIGENSVLTFSIINSGSTSIPAGSIEITMDYPEFYYFTDGVSVPSGVGAGLFTWTFTAPSIWKGVNNTVIPAFDGGDIIFNFTGKVVSTNFETTNINVQPVASFGSFSDSPGNNNVQPKLKINLGLDSDADGYADYDDLDDDNDGILDTEENLSACGNTVVSTGNDLDCDNDGIPNRLDLDSDGDGIFDVLEAGGPDGDGDGIIGSATPSVDSNGVPTLASGGLILTDSDGTDGANPYDQDADGDGILDNLEDTNLNGLVDIGETAAYNADSDGDGLNDGEEDINLNGIKDANETDPRNPDTDGDAVNDFIDACPLVFGNTPSGCPATVELVDLALSSSVDQSCEVAIGDTVTFELLVFRQDNSDSLVTVSIRDSISQNLRITSFTTTHGNFANGIWSDVIISKNDTAKLIIKAYVLTTIGGLSCNKAYILTSSLEDIDSQAGNQNTGEDDIAQSCISIPISICPDRGEQVTLQIPAGYASYEWFKDGVLLPTETTNSLLVTAGGSYSVIVDGNTCGHGGCCPILVVENCFCPTNICVPFIISKNK